MTDGYEQLRRLRERLHDERPRQHGIARKVIREHVVEPGDVRGRLDPAREIDIDDATSDFVVSMTVVEYCGDNAQSALPESTNN